MGYEHIELHLGSPIGRLVLNRPERRNALSLACMREIIDAATAFEWGLVNQVVPAATLDDAVADLAARLAGASAYVIALGKRAFYAQDALREDAAYDIAAAVMVENVQAADAHEGMRAF